MKLAIFDFDGTLLRVDTLPYMLRLWGEFGYSKMRKWRTYFSIIGLYMRYKLGLNGRMTREQMKKTALQKFTKLFAGMTRAQVEIYFEQCTDKIMAQINKNVAAEVGKVKAQGYHTVILSGCYEKLLALVAQKLGIDGVLGTKIRYFENDVADVAYKMDIKTGVDKVNRIQEAFPDADLKASCAYADSISDLALLELVGLPVAVAPDVDLKAFIDGKDWRVID